MSDCTAKGVASWALAAAFAAVMAGVSSSSASDDWIRPSALKPGDTIAFVAPSGPAEMPPLRRYAEMLEGAGYKVLIPEGIVRDGRRSDAERADELNAMIRDPKVRAIFPVRGGYGLTRILDRIDYAALRKDPKIVTGYSDLTALHLAIARKARLVSFHAPMPMSHLWQGDKPEFAFEAASFRRAVFADHMGRGASGYTIAVPADGKPERLVGGDRAGPAARREPVARLRDDGDALRDRAPKGPSSSSRTRTRRPIASTGISPSSDWRASSTPSPGSCLGISAARTPRRPRRSRAS